MADDMTIGLAIGAAMVSAYLFGMMTHLYMTMEAGLVELKRLTDNHWYIRKEPGNEMVNVDRRSDSRCGKSNKHQQQEFKMRMLEVDKYEWLLAASKFRVKIKSLAAEARIIRHECKKRRGIGCNRLWGSVFIADNLRYHNKGVVAVEQRHTLLAYAILKGKSYASVEKANEDNMPSTQKIRAILKSLASNVKQLDNFNVDAWLAGKPVVSKATA